MNRKNIIVLLVVLLLSLPSVANAGYWRNIAGKDDIGFYMVHPNGTLWHFIENLKNGKWGWSKG